MVWCGVVWCGKLMVWCGMLWYGVVWCGGLGYGLVWHGVIWYGMVSFFNDLEPSVKVIDIFVLLLNPYHRK